jgi:hypothetical protein
MVVTHPRVLTGKQRHILVKGCGKRGEDGSSKEGDALVRTESHSDDADDSPGMSEQA